MDVECYNLRNACGLLSVCNIHIFTILIIVHVIHFEAEIEIDIGLFRFCSTKDTKTAVTKFARNFRTWRKLCNLSNVHLSCNKSVIFNFFFQPSEQGEVSFQSLAQSFLLRWSFITSKIIQELTLRSAKSFGN